MIIATIRVHMIHETLKIAILCDPFTVWIYEYGASPSILDRKYKGLIAEKISRNLNMFKTELIQFTPSVLIYETRNLTYQCM
jgi:hypothetical protein